MRVVDIRYLFLKRQCDRTLVGSLDVAEVQRMCAAVGHELFDSKRLGMAFLKMVAEAKEEGQGAAREGGRREKRVSKSDPRCRIVKLGPNEELNDFVFC